MKAVVPNVLSKWMSLCVMKREVLCNPNKMTITVFLCFLNGLLTVTISASILLSMKWEGKMEDIHK